ncbi:EamA family transporter [Facklamia miroungae]|uniref:Multidrug transporter EmrE n=1 Tax=Facklamia miroungae TaxID=120956 RepID=A0A1G7TCX2_9LACT|nr:EamA family transporter [Facklamia miroungae]NKZ29760.1 EamA family transporter [Facklamia miroungae]SDG32874.1 Multidrug transporter EmrE [Facklamia miroungae]
MFYLFLATVCSATIALVFKYANNVNANRYLVTSANYFTAFIISLFMIWSKDLLIGIEKTKGFLTEFSYLLTQETYTFSAYASLIWAIIVGSIAGLFFFSSFIYYQKSIRENGVSISGTFSKLGILIPMLFSILIWKEFPTIVQWIGIVLSILSILIVNLSSNSLDKLDIKPSIILLFLLNGMAEFSNKIYQNYGLMEYKEVFLLFVFLIAFLMSLFFIIREKVLFNRKDILIGFAVGLPNLFSSYFLIQSLETVKTSVAFPIFSVGSIVFINLGGYFIFKEKIARKNQLAIGLIIIALVLMNI